MKNTALIMDTAVRMKNLCHHSSHLAQRDVRACGMMRSFIPKTVLMDGLTGSIQIVLGKG